MLHKLGKKETLNIIFFSSDKGKVARRSFINRLRFINCLKKRNDKLGLLELEEITNRIIRFNINAYKLFNATPEWKRLYSEHNKFFEADSFLKKVNFDQTQNIDGEELLFNIAFDIGQKHKKLQHSEVFSNQPNNQPKSLFSIAFNNIAERFNPNSEYLRRWILPLMGYDQSDNIEDLIKEGLLENFGLNKNDIKNAKFVYEQRNLAGELWAFHKCWCDKCTHSERFITCPKYVYLYPQCAYSQEDVWFFNSRDDRLFLPAVKRNCFYKGTKLFCREDEILIEWKIRLEELERKEIEELISLKKEWRRDFGKFFLEGTKETKVARDTDSNYPYYSFICFASRRHAEYSRKIDNIKQWAFSHARELDFLEKKETREGEANGLFIIKKEEFNELKKNDYYASLDISKKANENEIREAYLAKRAKWQLILERVEENLYCGLTRELLEEGIKKITKSYEILSSSRWRSLYDYWLFEFKGRHNPFDMKRDEYSIEYPTDDELFLKMYNLIDSTKQRDIDRRRKLALIKKEEISIWTARLLNSIKTERRGIIPTARHFLTNANAVLISGFIFIMLIASNMISKFSRRFF